MVGWKYRRLFDTTHIHESPCEHRSEMSKGTLRQAMLAGTQAAMKVTMTWPQTCRSMPVNVSVNLLLDW